MSRIPAHPKVLMEVILKRHPMTMVIALLALACLAVPAAAQVAAKPAAPAKPADMKKIVAEIAGDYEFSPGSP